MSTEGRGDQYSELQIFARIDTFLLRGHGAIRQRLSAPVFASRLS